MALIDDAIEDMPLRPSNDRLQRALADVKQILGSRLSTSASVLTQHGEDHTWHDTALPDAVAYVKTTEEISDIVKICARDRIPIVPFGAGTSLEGHLRALHGGLTLNFTEMNDVLRVSAEDMDCTVQPGVTRKQINHYLRDTGLFFPIDPGADASIGGMAATRASGTNAVRYGTMRENVLSLKAVMADGEIVTTARRARKSSSGYDLTRLLVGSEGTLGVITEVTLKLYGIPEAISGGVCPFETLEGACNTAIETIQSGIPIARVELLDALHVRAINNYSKLTLPEMDTLFVEFHGSPASVEEQADLFGQIAKENGGLDFQWSSDTDERNKLWQARHDSFWAGMNIAPGRRGMVTDVCVPISRLAECVIDTKKDIDETKLIAPIVGHVGDGNFHLNIMVDPDDKEELKRAKAFSKRLVERALDMEGTCSGEHGVGYGKMAYLEAEHGHGVDIMRQIKRALDPLNILNPGKIVMI